MKKLLDELEVIPVGGRVKDLTGSKFNSLTVISRAPNKRHYPMWNCLCDCGNYTTVRGSSVEHGATKTCGCALAEVLELLKAANVNKLEDLSGKKFGRWTVISRAKNGANGATRWNCVCDCGSKKMVRAHGLKQGTSGSCGCKISEKQAIRMASIFGEAHPSWKGGGKLIDPEGYVSVYVPALAGRKSRRIREHVWVMEQHIGRPLAKGESVHHLNGVRADNRIENLELWVKTQPAGQRASDLVLWAKEILKKYDVT